MLGLREKYVEMTGVFPLYFIAFALCQYFMAIFGD